MKDTELESRLIMVEGRLSELTSRCNWHEIELTTRTHIGDFDNMKVENETNHRQMWDTIVYLMTRCDQLEKIIKETWGITNVDDLL